MTLRAVHGDRAEGLLAALLDALPPADPFAPSTIVVGSHLVARWLTREIARARGIAAGLELLAFDRFVAQTWEAPGVRALDRRQLGAAIASVLDDDDFVASQPAVAAYLAAAPAPGDRAGPRRVQLADHLAQLAWMYALSRPDWMPALSTGHVPSELAADPTARWQAAILGEALARTGGAAPTPMLPWLRRRTGEAPPTTQPVAVFGFSFLARAQLEALTDLSQTSDVTVYVLDPCAELWDDVAGRSAAATATATATATDGPRDPLPLVLWGKPVRDTLAALVERTGGDVDDRFATDEPETALGRLLADVRARRPAEGSPAREAGVTVHACPNARREIEEIAAAARRALDADPQLGAHQIGVWIAGDAETYLAQAPAAFEAVGVPCHLIDAPVDDRGRIGEAVLALLELPGSPLARRDVLRVLTHPAVLAGYPHVDAADWIAWTERLGIVHGADGDSRDGTYLEEHRTHFHWDQGVRRLALGAFMVGERGERGPARIGGHELAPEELRPDQQASAATYALLVRSLAADARWLADHRAPLAGWADVFAGLVDAYLAPRDDEARRDLERVRKILAGIARLDLDERELGFAEARAHAQALLGSERADRGEALAAGVMIAPLAAQRAIPFRAVFVCGLDEGAFPAADRSSALDLRKTARLGDVAPRDRDRAAFLDVLLGARDSLALSYVALEPKSGQPLAPSSVVLELADALAPYLGAGSSKDALAQLTITHPLHRFGGDAPALLPATARERWAASVRDSVRDALRARACAVPDADGMLALVSRNAPLAAALGIVEPPAPAVAAAAAARPIGIANVRGFLESPVQAWSQAVLGLDELPDDEIAEQSDEPFHLDRPSRAALLRDVLGAHLRAPGESIEARYDAEVRARQLRGQFPVGVFAEAARVVDLEMLAAWRAGLGTVAVGATRLGFGRATARDAALEPALDLELAGAGNVRRVRLVGQTELLVTAARRTSVIASLRELSKKDAYHLRGAIDHVVLAAAGLAPDGHAHVLLGPGGERHAVTHDAWTRDDARAYLRDLVTELLDEAHGYLLPFDALASALAGKPKDSATRGDSLARALGFGPVARADGLRAPADPVAIARRRLGPLVDRMRGDHGFGGDS
ncbi:MAG TPA: exodeoxyribonuclease V subunit gamma [Kofleriaceae bacterium]|jgi:exodeoxyribonuclease V gamma subunit